MILRFVEALPDQSRQWVIPLPLHQTVCKQTKPKLQQNLSLKILLESWWTIIMSWQFVLLWLAANMVYLRTNFNSALNLAIAFGGGTKKAPDTIIENAEYIVAYLSFL